jgi:hypothetical protein
MEIIQLKPCPFCGSRNITTVPFYTASSVRCLACDVDGPVGDIPTCEARWNIRPAEVSFQKVLEGVADLLEQIANCDGTAQLNADNLKVLIDEFKKTC